MTLNNRSTCSTLRLSIRAAVSWFYPLRLSPDVSTATSFMTTTASSADPRYISVALLHCIVLKETQFLRHIPTALHPVRSVAQFCCNLPCLPLQVTESIGTSIIEGILSPAKASPRFTVRSDHSLDLGFLRIHHWLWFIQSFFRHPYHRLHIPSSQGCGEGFTH